MPLRDNTDRLFYDACSLQQRDASVRMHAAYLLQRMRPRSGTPCEAASAMACGAGGVAVPAPLCSGLQLGLLQPWDGYGLDTDAIDCDSTARQDPGALTHAKTRQQLNARVFHAVPDLQLAAPDCATAVESKLQSGVDTSFVRDCNRLGELQLDRFVPGVCAPDVRNIVPTWVNGGAFSRDIARSAPFRQRVLDASGATACDNKGKRKRKGRRDDTDAAADDWMAEWEGAMAVADGLPAAP